LKQLFDKAVFVYLLLYWRYNADMNRHLFLLLPGWLWLAASVLAADVRLPEKAAATFLQAQNGEDGYAYRLAVQRQKAPMPACPQDLQTGWPAGSAPPRSYLEVSCAASGWILRLPVLASELPMALVTTRLVRSGEVLQAADVRLAAINRNQASQGLRNPEQVLGRMVTATVPAGTVLQGGQLRVPYVVKMNQPVRLLAKGDGFVIGSDGTALGNAGVGERVNVRAGNGKVVAGVVEQDGSVSVLVP
jgi:flagella basal body P-ring formation protein FlgA